MSIGRLVLSFAAVVLEQGGGADPESVRRLRPHVLLPALRGAADAGADPRRAAAVPQLPTRHHLGRGTRTRLL